MLCCCVVWLFVCLFVCPSDEKCNKCKQRKLKTKPVETGCACFTSASCVCVCVCHSLRLASWCFDVCSQTQERGEMFQCMCLSAQCVLKRIHVLPKISCDYNKTKTDMKNRRHDNNNNNNKTFVIRYQGKSRCLFRKRLSRPLAAGPCNKQQQKENNNYNRRRPRVRARLGKKCARDVY